MLGFAVLSFVITIALELPIIWLFTRKNIHSLIGYVFVINLFTWPLTNIANDYTSIYITETGVVLVESVLFMLLLNIKYPKALFVSFTANVVSAIAGYLLIFLYFTKILSLSHIL